VYLSRTLQIAEALYECGAPTPRITLTGRRPNPSWRYSLRQEDPRLQPLEGCHGPDACHDGGDRASAPAEHQRIVDGSEPVSGRCWTGDEPCSWLVCTEDGVWLYRQRQELIRATDDNASPAACAEWQLVFVLLA
jgi:hypothetical protein